ncbi:TRZ/ATZ family hydrolase [Pseudohaliea rubra]|uniref:5-methylthioadenosine/S-adenosylhomocysteine deaminase n=1 Tax=Pseudohaliea rubra DSM 19751 TaxID=1265313 RepID=A0A095VV44_9GAMM|nr:TRZ/ATZ family hydrolase [Pseudohaliea rubra]KGE05337.1 S-adenosylhomocysteine deaminase, Methylthioadenosine deaminase [Pseudohaliea rubra DSM 19751]
MTTGTTAADLLIHPRWIVPVVPEGQVLEQHSLAIRDGVIIAIVPRAEAAGIEAAEQLELPCHALLPGLVNAHGHAAMALLRGYADDLPLMPWLQEHIWPAEGAWVSDAFVRDGVRLAALEMLESGTTTCSDMYFFPEVAAREYLATGLRAQLAFPIFDFPTAWGSGPDDYLAKGLALRDELRHEDRITVVFGPHAPYTVGEDTLARIATLAAELDVPVHIHLHETTAEVLQAVEATGERPVDTLQRIGLLGPRTQCVHMTDAGRQDIELLAATGAHVVHCPQSNMKLASGACPVTRLLDAGVNVALGTDGAASNNDLNLFNEMHSAALLAKLSTGDASALPAARVLTMATLGGARALGLEQRIGSVEPGKQADLIAVDLSGPAQQPVYNPLSTLVYACTGGEVSHSWVAGRAVLANGRPLQLDRRAVLSRAEDWRARIQAGPRQGGPGNADKETS